MLFRSEWFLTGDARFMEKARVRLEELVRDAEIMVLSAHSLDVIRQWCNRAIWLEHGRVVADGPTREVLDRYLSEATGEHDGEPLASS